MKSPFFIIRTAVIALGVTTAVAGPLGTDITISDGNFKGSGWYSDREDNETETNPNTINTQVWDLEGMYSDASALTIVGGFNFQTGVTHAGHTYRGGDLFIDVTGDAVYGQAANGGSGLGGVVTNSFGYDYVLDFNSSYTSYTVFQVSESSLVSRGTDVASSNPWSYVSGGTAVAGYESVAVGGLGLLDHSVYSVLTTYGSTSPGLKGDGLGLPTSDLHYYLTVDLSFLPADTLATLHYTLECGNDNLMGQYTTPTSVPEGGSTLLLAAASMLALFTFSRKRSLAATAR